MTRSYVGDRTNTQSTFLNRRLLTLIGFLTSPYIDTCSCVRFYECRGRKQSRGTVGVPLRRTMRLAWITHRGRRSIEKMYDVCRTDEQHLCRKLFLRRDVISTQKIEQHGSPPRSVRAFSSALACKIFLQFVKMNHLGIRKAI
jgi:hypothetical protein